MTPPADNRAKILVVDDEATNLQMLRHVLQDDYRLVFAKNGPKALELAHSERPDLVLLDIMMPGMTGYEVCEALKREPSLRHIPVIFVSTLTDTEDEAKGFAVGAVDYLTKPASPAIVKARVRAHLSLVQIDALRDTRLEIIRRLGLAAEFKDNETGMHVIRMSYFSRILGEAAGLGPADVENLFNAAPMHDVGKIGIPDAVLLKKGALTAEEWAVMRTHSQIGADILGTHPPGLMQVAHEVAISHHEKWDGSGYPHGLAGTAIPIAGRIAAIADVFDALTSARPYKASWTVEAALDLLRAQSGKHFDPALVALFLEHLPEILEVKDRWAETTAPEHHVAATA
ncbi:two-component system response regulator [Rhodoferax sp. WC2427]|uniref:response regulator n=1 Tax=Rhodoferax sp. WC2427 TaxID=3234144 RepID=UPI00346767CF